MKALNDKAELIARNLAYKATLEYCEETCKDVGTRKLRKAFTDYVLTNGCILFLYLYNETHRVHRCTSNKT